MKKKKQESLKMRRTLRRAKMMLEYARYRKLAKALNLGSLIKRRRQLKAKNTSIDIFSFVKNQFESFKQKGLIAEEKDFSVLLEGFSNLFKVLFNLYIWKISLLKIDNELLRNTAKNCFTKFGYEPTKEEIEIKAQEIKEK